MIRRSLNLSKVQSFFIFGPRGVGKSTLIRERFGAANPLWIDLLTDADEDRFGRNPDELSRRLDAGAYDLVVIDEIQKAPKLLDIVHHEIERRKNCRFILSGSSARKLRRDGANLLAGRAIAYHLHPFTHVELGENFDLNAALAWGTLPRLHELMKEEESERLAFLRTYVRTYLKEEIISEQIIRNVDPFRDFLEAAAQANGTAINHSSIARDVGVDDKTVKNYFQILEDTLVGFQLKPFHRSIRKRQRESSKFYFFDTGVKRALDGTLSVALLPQTYAYGKAFEHWLILEAFRLNDYSGQEFRFSFLQTKDDAEIDLIIERAGKPDLLVEIKSTVAVDESHARTLKRFAADWNRPCEAQIWSNDPHAKRWGQVESLHWRTALERAFPLLSKIEWTPINS